MGVSDKARGCVFVMIGPGGAGKNAIMKAILAGSPGIRQLATATTRPMRADERQGREHLFVSRERFTEMIARGELLEHQEVTPGKFYGIPRQSVTDVIACGGVRIADIEVLGAQILAGAFPDNVVQIFVTVAGVDLGEQLRVLERRMRGRADNYTDIAERLRRAQTLELPYQRQCDYVLVNDKLDEAVAAAREIIQSELMKRSLLEAPT